MHLGDFHIVAFCVYSHFTQHLNLFCIRFVFCVGHMCGFISKKDVLDLTLCAACAWGLIFLLILCMSVFLYVKLYCMCMCMYPCVCFPVRQVIILG